MQNDFFREGQKEDLLDTSNGSNMKPSLFERVQVVLTLDKIILWSLLNITAIVFVYSFGVEQGMKTATGGGYVFDLKNLFNRQHSLPAARPENIAITAEDAAPATVTAALPEAGAALKAVARLEDDKTKKQESLKEESVKAEKQAAAVPQKGFTIQLVTYKTEKQAKQEVERLKAKGFNAFSIASGKHFQVCVDSFDEKAKAAGRLAEFKTGNFRKLYQGAYIRPLRPVTA